MRIEDGGSSSRWRRFFHCLRVGARRALRWRRRKFRFPIGESSKTLSYGPLWVAAKMGFFEREGLDVPIVTMRGSPLTIQALTADSIYVASATVDTLINAYERGADITMIGGLINGLGLEHDRRQAIQDLRRSARHDHRLADAYFRHRVRPASGDESPRPGISARLQAAEHRQRVGSLQALTSGQISSAPVGVPLDLVAKQQGFNIIGYFADDQPNFQFNVYIVKRSWAEKNRPLVVRFMKAMVATMRWMADNREPACAYLTKEMSISMEHCRYASDYNWKNRIWDRNADLNVEGVRTIINLTADQGVLKEPLPQPSKYIDPSYLKQALAEIGKK